MRIPIRYQHLLYLTLIVLIAGVIWAPNLYWKFSSLMEVRNLQAAREMAVDGHWIVPTLNGFYRFEKPPLPTWVTAAVMEMSSAYAQLWVLRLPVFFISLLQLFATYLLVWKESEQPRLALLASLVMATTYGFINIGTENTWDLYNYTFIFLGCTLTLLALREDSSSRKALRLFIAVGITIGLSILSKGPVALYGMFLPFLLAYAISYGVTPLKNHWRNLLYALLIGALLGGSWYLAMYCESDAWLLSVINKESTTWEHHNVKSFWYYLGYLPQMGVWLFPAIIVLIRPLLSATLKTNRLFNLVYIWHLTSLLLLSLVGMKSMRYASPLFILNAILVAMLLHDLLLQGKNLQARWVTGLLKAETLLIAVVASALPIAFLLFSSTKPLEVVIPLLLSCSALLYLGYRCYKQPRFAIQLVAMPILLIGLYSLTFTAVKVERFDRKAGDEYPLLEQAKLQAPVFALENPDVRNVWVLQQQIKLIDGDQVTLPEEFYLISEKDLTEDAALKAYQQLGVERYYANPYEKATVYLYHVRKQPLKPVTP